MEFYEAISAEIEALQFWGIHERRLFSTASRYYRSTWQSTSVDSSHGSAGPVGRKANSLTVDHDCFVVVKTRLAVVSGQWEAEANMLARTKYVETVAVLRSVQLSCSLRCPGVGLTDVSVPCACNRPKAPSMSATLWCVNAFRGIGVRHTLILQQARILEPGCPP